MQTDLIVLKSNRPPIKNRYYKIINLIKNNKSN